jgi:hypothetical protein
MTTWDRNTGNDGTRRPAAEKGEGRNSIGCDPQQTLGRRSFPLRWSLEPWKDGTNARNNPSWRADDFLVYFRHFSPLGNLATG